MIHQTLPLSATGTFPALFLDYIAQKEELNPFYGHFPTLENFKKQIESKQISQEARSVLVRSLQNQYKHLKTKPDFETLLAPNTFTVTTGHQLNIFTGPLYVVYKIVTAINLAKKLKAAYPDHNFIPVYWLASEDHDFAEICYFNLFGKKYTWQTDEKGAVGRMNPRTLGEALKILPERVPVFEKAYLKNDTLADAVRCYMNDLFGNEGLMCVDGDDADLKRLFLPVVKDELLNQKSQQLVDENTRKIEALGYHTQISPREINLFYLDNQLRERIVCNDDSFNVLNTELRFSESQILNIAEQYPERFSPNVVLRPLYQETILPNLAYIGGPSEVPYWLQLKGLFDFHKMPMPLLMPRNFALYVTETLGRCADRLGIEIKDLFQDETKLKKSFVSKNTTATLSLDDEKKEIVEVLERILTKSIEIDRSLEGTVKAETTKLINAIENLEKRIQKAEERHHDTEINQLIGLKSKLFPNGGLQERQDNFLNFYLNDTTFLRQLLDRFDPIEFSFNVLISTND